jgi:hypothetical protein
VPWRLRFFSGWGRDHDVRRFRLSGCPRLPISWEHRRWRAGRNGPMGFLVGCSDRRRASPRWPVHPFVRPEAPSRTDVPQPPRIAAAAATNRHHDFIDDSPKPQPARITILPRQQRSNAAPALSRGRGALAKAQKGEVMPRPDAAALTEIFPWQSTVHARSCPLTRR